MLVMDIINETLAMFEKSKFRIECKTCSSCKEVKNVSYFFKSRRSKDGYSNTCKQCNKERIDKWKKDNPDKIRNIWRKDKQHRRSSLKTATSYLFPNEWEKLKEQYNYKCAYCGKEKKLFQDHVIPINGDNGTGYIVPACEECNSSKYNHNVQDWLKEMKRYEE